jgi:hypothetical protein
MQLPTLTERRLPSLNAVRSFEAAARHLSFTLAARELSVTHGAVSRLVQALELTPAGAAYTFRKPWRALPQPPVRSATRTRWCASRHCVADFCHALVGAAPAQLSTTPPGHSD